MQHILDAIRTAMQSGTYTNLMKVVVDTFLTHRQIGESEAFFKIFPSLLMRNSNCQTEFLPTGFPSNRSNYCDKLPENHNRPVEEVMKIDGKEGDYFKKPSKISKYERRNVDRNEALKSLTYIQFGMKYASSHTGPKNEDGFESTMISESDIGFELTDEMGLIVTEDFIGSKTRLTLPQFIELTNLCPGEPGFMKRRRERYAVRMHKVNRTASPHEYIYSMLQLYRPFMKEEELFPEDHDACLELFNERSVTNDALKVENNRSLLMKYIAAVEDGMGRAQEMQQDKDSDIAAELNPGLVQDNEDCDAEGVTDNADFQCRNPDLLDNTTAERRVFRHIEVIFRYCTAQSNPGYAWV